MEIDIFSEGELPLPEGTGYEQLTSGLDQQDAGEMASGIGSMGDLQGVDLLSEDKGLLFESMPPFHPMMTYSPLPESQQDATTSMVNTGYSPVSVRRFNDSPTL
ncbi:hypothetical protein D7B24_009551 [Verticillium nonalfalfae]|uniref:Uncharacterized protein n=1 Tax=Verticillium nonalfalfae TaxID=1051616 RepID=A0A3M9Y2B4_9PEZI|nr:uncharacterized protein D7B24_009551 [Verticillium nonalfalfae]RNJ54659.1 hypothetical protein D7B24_009551 [Verticillium nonalfalfae]